MGLKNILPAQGELFCSTFKTQAYDFFIGRLELQYPQEAD